MAIERVFLGWDGPCLPRAAGWIVDRFGAAGDEIDLSSFVLVTPGHRSGRRLLELLVEASAGRLLRPPQTATPGELFDHFCQPGKTLADPLRCLLARVACLRAADPDTLRLIAPAPPAKDELRGWLNIAADMQRLHETLAAESLAVRDVIRYCGGALEFDDGERWQALAALQDDYVAALARQGLADPNLARREAIDAGCVRDDARVILVAAADFPGIIRKLLAHDALEGYALVHAPEHEAGAFDSVGRLIPSEWTARRLDLDPRIVSVVDRPRDQAREALRLVSQLAAGIGPAPAVTPPPGPEQITLGLGDETIAPLIERTFELAGVPVRSVAGRPLSLGRPGLFLEAWGRFLDRRRFDDFAALLRHPDLEAFLQQALGPGTHEAVSGWITLLDRYLTEHIQREVSRQLVGPPEVTEPLRAVLHAVDGLLPAEGPGPRVRRPLPEWSAAIAGALSTLYRQRPLDRQRPDDAPLIHALRVLGDALREQARLDPADPATLAVSLPEAITLTLSRVRDLAPPPPEPAGACVELLGWLELQLDDAPCLIVTGVNEGQIPESVSHDAFLPDSIRRALGLLDNNRRYARDLMALTAILQSRPFVQLITGRRSVNDDPLTPSRLLLACEGEELAQRVRTFYDHAHEPAPAPPLLATGTRSRLLIPPPVPPEVRIEELDVTAFRDYLACPYRFYLRHVCGIATLDDRAVELSAPAFGSLAHRVLDHFGRSELANSSRAEEITAFLNDKLDRLCKTSYGPQPTVAILLQREQLRRRLEAFARWQARQAREGWTIVGQTEKRLVAPFAVDDEAFRIVGRIDRIDRHPELGLRILDYKTGDKGQTPEETHQFRGEWTNLQLPLYRLLVRAAGLDGPCQLGFVLLPRKIGETGAALAEWSDADLSLAEEKARQVVRAVRKNLFWPPDEPPRHDDGYGAICLDAYADRQRVIASAGQTRGGTRA